MLINSVLALPNSSSQTKFIELPKTCSLLKRFSRREEQLFRLLKGNWQGSNWSSQEVSLVSMATRPELWWEARMSSSVWCPAPVMSSQLSSGYLTASWAGHQRGNCPRRCPPWWASLKLWLPVEVPQCPHFLVSSGQISSSDYRSSYYVLDKMWKIISSSSKYEPLSLIFTYLQNYHEKAERSEM